jgi:hypothetical protein
MTDSSPWCVRFMYFLGRAITQALVAGFPPRWPGFNLRSGHVKFWWIKWHGDRFPPSTPVSLANWHSTSVPQTSPNIILCLYNKPDSSQRKYHLCSLVVRVPGCRPRVPGFDFRHYQIFWIAMNPLSRMSLNEELLERKCRGSDLENWD